MTKLILTIAAMFALSNMGMSFDGVQQYQDMLLGLSLALVLSPWLARQFD